MSSDPHSSPRRDPTDPPEGATERIEPVPGSPVESYSAGWPAASSAGQTEAGAQEHQQAQRPPLPHGAPDQQDQAFYGQQQHGEGHHGQAQHGQDAYGQNQYDQNQYGQNQYDQNQYGQAQYGQGAYDQTQYGQHPAFSPYGYGGQPAGAEQRPERPKRTVGVGGLALAVVLAGLLGGGVGAGSAALWDEDGISTSQSGGIEINNPESATVVTAAAAKASPSVVTLAVNEGGQGGSGSGIILDDQGHVLTNTHVVTLGGAAANPEIQVRMSDGSVSDAEVVGTDPLSDLAVVQLEDIEGIQPAELGSSGDLNVGNQTIAIGAPLGLAGTVTDGIVSTLNRTISVASSAVEDEAADAPDVPEETEDGEGFEFYFPDMEGSPTQGSIHLNVIQTDAAINRGNSGGALVDDEGRVIGVNVAIASSGGGAETDAGSIGVGFAVPIDYAQRVAEELIADGEVSHGLLGVTVAAAGSQDATDQSEQSEQGLAPTMPGFTVGALIDEVPDASPAEDAGLQAGDIITAVNDRRIEDSIALTATIREYAAGESVTVTYQRDGEQNEVEVTLGGI
ncbi:trypsin-like peptidase domain-containing protein [Nesterenkonia lutea]|uniref:Serine protease PepD n=1 Tax=Nesterenkonia lutea TaxID=272919 RepID=A0ABR9JF24_9MICC|nr:trypsin-like peptidase domain-containing protein [Nesterenkonia lutea]MBE1524534.1 putative serine protease PepD [Nesterenkonia lutea]